MQLSYVLMVFATLTTSIPIIIFLLKIDRQPLMFKWLTILLCFSFVCDLIGQMLLYLKMNPNAAGNVYGLFGTLLLSIFFYYVLEKPSLKWALVVINVAYFLFAFTNTIFIQKAEINTYSQVFQSLYVLILCILFFYKLIVELPTQQLQRLPLFWIISAFFLSYAGKLVIYTTTYYLIHFEGDDLTIIWSFHNLLTIIGNFLIGYGAWLNHKQLKSTSLSQ